jgi:hypothetical protein
MIGILTAHASSDSRCVAFYMCISAHMLAFTDMCTAISLPFWIMRKSRQWGAVRRGSGRRFILYGIYIFHSSSIFAFIFQCVLGHMSPTDSICTKADSSGLCVDLMDYIQPHLPLLSNSRPTRRCIPTLKNYSVQLHFTSPLFLPTYLNKSPNRHKPITCPQWHIESLQLTRTLAPRVSKEHRYTRKKFTMCQANTRGVEL